jgi:uncharacterized protein
MPTTPPLETAIAGHQQAPADWMSASQVGAFIHGDPAIVWLEYHSAEHGFQPDTSPYAFGDFVAEKGRQFEGKWMRELAPNAVRVCAHAGEGRYADRVRETVQLMQQGAPAIAQPALWWAPERIYGVPDLLAHTSWLRERFPGLMDERTSRAAAPYLGQGGQTGHYVALDLKFTTKLDGRSKAQDLEAYTAQLQVYNHMMGQLQGLMPQQAFLIARDRVDDPLPVAVAAQLDGPLDKNLAAMRDQVVEIKLNGARYTPWQDEIVAPNPSQQDERWATAEKTIAREMTPGGDPTVLYNVGASAKVALAEMGYTNLKALLEADPADIPLEDCCGIGGEKARQIRAVLKANRSGAPVRPPAELVPHQREFEFFVDFEYFTNVNVDFETQWPGLEGHEMVFMIGVGREPTGNWEFRTFVAGAEEPAAELRMFEALRGYLQEATGGAVFDTGTTALYHWTSAEVWQARRVAERHQLAEGHVLRRLPWCDLQKVFLDGPAALPGAWNFRLKGVADALGKLDTRCDTQWPGELDKGLQAMVMGWQAYQSPRPEESDEMRVLKQYLEADCQALWQILRWLRATPED